MIFLSFLKYIIKILKSNESANQIAMGFILGMFMGITPFWSLLNFILMFIVIIFNVNIAAAMLAYAVFSAFVYILDPVLHDLGFWLLVHLPFLKPVWTYLYHAPIFPFTDYNNTVYLGSMVIFLLISWPVFRMVKNFILHYRDPRFKLNDDALKGLQEDGVPNDILAKLQAGKGAFLGEKRFSEALTQVLGRDTADQYKAPIIKHTRFPSYEEKIQNSRWLKWLKATPFYRWYERVEAFRS